MATSGSWDYSVTASSVITAAAENIGLIAAGDTIDTGDFASILKRLNFIVKQWQGKADMAQGLKVWTRQRLSIFLNANQIRYSIGPAATDDRASVNALATTLGAAKAANATAITLTSTAGMTDNDQIGFVTTAGSIGWTTITTVNSSVSVTVPANTIGAAAAGGVVYTYTSQAQRFPTIETAVLRDNSQAGQPIDLPVRIYTDVAQYEMLPQKYANGDPLSILVEPQRLNTYVTTDFAPANMWKNLRLTVIYPAEDYDSATGADDIAFPQEWFAALEWELSLRIAPMFGTSWTKEMQMNYVSATMIARQLNPDNTSSYFEPDKEYYSGRY